MENMEIVQTERLISLKKIICPIVTIWLLFGIRLIFNRSSIDDSPTLLKPLYPLNLLVLFIAGILITCSIEKNKTKLYLAGLITSIIYALLASVETVLTIINMRYRYRYRYRVYFFVIISYNVIVLLGELSLFIILICYRKKLLENSRNTIINRSLVIPLQ